MPDAFRSDLEAARSRADALEEENDELREEVARLRIAKPVDLGDANVRDPAIEKLTEETLERLDEMTHDIEAHDAPAAAPPPGAPRRVAEHAPTLAPELGRLRAELASTRAKLEQLDVERNALASRMNGIKIRAWSAFALGLVAGALLVAIFASLR